MYAIGLKDGDFIFGLVRKPFLTLKDAVEFVKKHDLSSEYDEVLILVDEFVYCSSLVDALEQNEKKRLTNAH